jgi:hypothetical protein
LLALGGSGTGYAFVLNLRVIQAAGPTTASTVTYLVPIWSTLIGAGVPFRTGRLEHRRRCDADRHRCRHRPSLGQSACPATGTRLASPRWCTRPFLRRLIGER